MSYLSIIALILTLLLLGAMMINRRLTKLNFRLREENKKIKASEQQFRYLIEEAPKAILTLTKDLQLIYANRAALHILGAKSKNELVGKGAYDLIIPTEHPLLNENMKKFVNGERMYDVIYKVKTLKENIINFEMSSILLHFNNEVCIQVIGEDITEKLKESEERYRILQRSLDHFTQDLSKVMTTTDLEERLILEIKEILKIDTVSIIEIDDRLNLYRCTGANSDFHEEILKHFDELKTIGELVNFGRGCFVKIGEIHGRINLLCIEHNDQACKRLSQAVWLQSISRYVSVLYENLSIIEDLAQELEQKSQDKTTPRWILRLLFHIAEKERFRLSADLHDSVLQNQILWYRKLQTLRSDKELPLSVDQELLLIENGLLEIIQQIRITCNFLRPPYLKEQGLIVALESLFSHEQNNVNFKIQFDYENLRLRITEEEMITLYRIAQELLANARKHSQADKVEFSLSTFEGVVYFNYQDNGVGMDFERLDYSFEHIGMSGIKKRVDSIGGEIELHSAPGKGFQLLISISEDNHKSGHSLLSEVFK
ncbi:ATP-binding protein [Neobacillus citreus]|uniref:histidine kinase n=1 Tax=Neobacillus citreus TaxID=2833578 RepID=A0A942Y670_9BACI|nr:ATP-binding protein [Neobacillus citreus]MCH6266807.1 PAS domain S-box protein [Neobacillus citreus]